MALGNRHFPPKSPEDATLFGLDWSAILPPGVGIASASLTIVTNTNPVQQQSDTTQGDVIIARRRTWATIGGGDEGTDYQFRWQITDTTGNVWQRTTLCLCAETG